MANGNKEENNCSLPKVKAGDLVKIDFVASLRDGVIFDTSIGFEADNCGIIDPDREYKPVEFIVGSNAVIKGLDDGLMGMEFNESKTFVISPNKAYGERDESKLRDLPVEIIGEKREPIIGEYFILKDEKGQFVNCLIKEVKDGRILADTNHPLAGKEIVITVKVLAINGKPAEKKSEEKNMGTYY
ncbi:MAG: FKBP-type peptidyl-prolyl cis-trans isomerase [Candidatus Woesearchaeota archaeon]|nr:FKBP-type peptidyl-prolyl cis-trans isomerase [Candidatus Woesearchaeota archaeon]